MTLLSLVGGNPVSSGVMHLPTPSVGDDTPRAHWGCSLQKRQACLCPVP